MWRKRIVEETFCVGDILWQETCCGGNVMLGNVSLGNISCRKPFVGKYFVSAPFYRQFILAMLALYLDHTYLTLFFK